MQIRKAGSYSTGVTQGWGGAKDARFAPFHRAKAALQKDLKHLMVLLANANQTGPAATKPDDFQPFQCFVDRGAPFAGLDHYPLAKLVEQQPIHFGSTALANLRLAIEPVEAVAPRLRNRKAAESKRLGPLAGPAGTKLKATAA
jgi:hypothetical protein